MASLEIILAKVLRFYLQRNENFVLLSQEKGLGEVNGMEKSRLKS